MGFSRVARILVLITILALLGLLSSENNSYSAVLSWTDDTSFIRDWKCRLPLLDTLNVASRIFVIGLPHRHFRRLQMERLRCILGLKFVYVDALYHTTPLVTHIMDQVRELRLASGVALEGNGTVPLGILEFSWPEDIDRLSNEVGPLEKRGSDLWLDSAPSPSLKDFFTLKKHLVPLTAALKNATIQPYYHDLRSSQILTAARVACWYSHTKLIRRIAESGNRSDEVSIVLEDDVDMEIDIRERLAGVWDSLPPDWEILFLGHCWSDESQHPALKVYESLLLGSSVSQTSLHPSRSPKCTHAYALTTRGARRLTIMLRHPPFAYSRALDQAIAWLVKSGQLRSYSLVPSIVVQMKVDQSDIFEGTGSSWKDSLNHGVFG